MKASDPSFIRVVNVATNVAIQGDLLECLADDADG